MPKSKKSDLKLLQRLSLFFFSRPRKTAVIFLILAVMGVLSYTTLLKREGFPKIEIPYAVSNGAYIVNSAEKVDNEVAKPLSDFILKQDGVKTVQSQAYDNLYNVIVQYDSGVKSADKSKEIADKIKAEQIIPGQASNKTEAVLFGYTERGDEMVISFYAKNPSYYPDVVKKAEEASKWLNDQNLTLVKDVSVINPYEKAINPSTGNEELTQKTFERFGQKENNQNKYYKAVVIGVNAVDGSDRIKLYDQVQEAVSKLGSDPKFSGYGAKITAADATSIREQVNELQKVLLEGFIAVVVVGSLIIAIRASLITVISMLSVLAITNFVLWILGFSLNTMTLFSLILGLSLIVDDTIIMVEALDNYRRRLKNPKDVVSTATRKVSRAMIAATLTAALSFAPLIFVGGIIGDFVRQIPITIITALLVSLFTALIFIPFFARKVMLSEDQINKKQKPSGASFIEHKIAEFIMKPMLWAKGSTAKLVTVSAIAIVISLGFIFGSGLVFQKTKFNIFPSSKDSNMITVSAVYPPGTSIDKAEATTKDIESKTLEVIGDNFVEGGYFGYANAQSSMQTITLTNYQDRSPTSQDYIKKLKDKFADYKEASMTFGQVDAGPPASNFNVKINTDKGRDKALKLANDIASFIKTAEIKRIDNSVVKIQNVLPPNTSVYTRDEGKPFLSVSVSYDDTDTTTLVTLTQEAVEKEFNATKLSTYGLDSSDISFSAGQEEENQDSFKTLLYAFPALMLAIYILLAFEFRSLLQPLLIFMAIPFSLLGVSLGLYLSNNPLSFFAMLGFFALIGLSIKNTILLTDYANQSRREGKGPVDAMHEALAERFRPLVATSLTAVVSLIPLAITSPFWEGLAYVLIGGLLSSTFLVVTVFPYYYLAGEFLRQKTRKLFRKLRK